jgi:hypothetical protein
VVRVRDVPARGGLAYLVERELERDGYEPLQALVAGLFAGAMAPKMP